MLDELAVNNKKSTWGLCCYESGSLLLAFVRFARLLSYYMLTHYCRTYFML